MNNATLEELKATHERLGKLIEEISANDSLQKLMSLIGSCYSTVSDRSIVAYRINRIDVQAEVKFGGRNMLIYIDSAEVFSGDNSTEISVSRDKCVRYTLSEALQFSLNYSGGAKLIKCSQFESIINIASNRRESILSDVLDAATV